MLFSICQRELSMPKTLEFITDHLPRVTVDEVRRFSDTVEIRDAQAFAAELEAFVQERIELVELPPSMEIPIEVETVRSEEHTSELQSRPHLVCRLLLEKKNRERPVRVLADAHAVVAGRLGGAERRQDVALVLHRDGARAGRHHLRHLRLVGDDAGDALR